jgi:hypothetical protein
MDAPCGSRRSTSNSGRSEDGKNCRGTDGSASIATTKQASVIRIVSQRSRMAATSTRRNVRRITLGCEGSGDCGLVSSATPSKGMKITATSHDASTAMLTTAKIENVYSPAELLANPIGTNPAIVTNDPVSIGKASVLYAYVAACSLSSPAARRIVIASIVLMASSTSSVSAMIRAPSEMRCRSMLTDSITGKTMASVSGIDSATMAPARNPRLTMLTAMMMAMACHSDSMNSPMALWTTEDWFATSVASMPIGKSAVSSSTVR